MGRKLGNFLIIYGVVNFFCCLVVAATGAPAFAVGGFIAMVGFILVGNWQRSKARAEEARDTQTHILEKIEKNQRFAGINRDELSNAINDILDEREGKQSDREALK